MIARHRDWQGSLTRYLARMARQPGRIGTHDCVIFCAGAVEAMTGWQPDPALLSYRTEADGLRRLQEAGYDGIPAFMSAHFPDQPIAMARPGDLVWVVRDDTAALGVLQGDQVYVASEGGVGLMARRFIRQSWRIG